MLIVGLFGVMILKKAFNFGAKNLKFIRVRLSYVMFILMLFVPHMNIIFVISTSNDHIINTIYA